MARIPTITSQVDARTTRTQGGIPSPRATADAFGMAQARGLQDLGQGLDAAAGGLMAYQDRKRKEDVANKLAQGDFTADELAIRNEVGPGADGYQDQVLSRYDEWVDEQLEGVDDPQTAEALRQSYANERRNVSSRSAQYQFSTAAQNSQDQANVSLTTLDNKLRMNPDQYDTYISQGIGVIDARADLPANIRENMKTTWRANAAAARFDGMLERATTVEEVQAVKDTLAGDDKWASEFSATGLQQTLARADAVQRTIVTQNDANARAAIEGIEERAKDVTVALPEDELAAVASVVGKSQNPVTAARFARIQRDQQIIRSRRGMTPAQQQSALDAQGAPRLPVRVNSAIARASASTGIPQSYLAATASREYGMYLKGDESAIDYGKGNAGGASSATGIGQIVDGTADMVFRSAEFQAAAGMDTSGMSVSEIREMRKNPELSMIAVAVLAKGSQRVVQSVMGRPATDAELYMGHFLGEGGLRTLLNGMKSDPNQSAAALFPAQAKANGTVYYNKDGSARTLQEVYNELGRTMSNDPTYVEYGDAQTQQKILDDTRKRLQDDPMSLAFNNGVTGMSDVTQPDGMQQRGQEARTVASYYNLPVETMKPFTKQEADDISATLKNGSTDDALQIITSVQQMGGDVARAAMRQIGADGNVYAYAGGMGLATGNMAVASDVVRGQKRLEENPNIKQEIGATPDQVATAFTNAVGGSLYDLAPAARQSIQDAALAHYVETSVARGKAGAFNEDAFGASIQAVMGGNKDTPAVEEVNGQKVVLPPGVTGDALQSALDRMTVADWSAMSTTGLPPMYADGTVAQPQDLADEAVLRAIGAGQYKVAVGDGTYLITGRQGPNGRPEAYVFAPNAEAIANINTRTAQAPDAPAAEQGVDDTGWMDPDTPLGSGMTAEDIQALRDKYSR